MITIRVGKRRHDLAVIVDRYLRGAAASLIVRFVVLPFRSRKPTGRIALVGHEPNGNLYAFARYLSVVRPELDVFYALDDPRRFRALRAAGDRKVHSLQRLRDVARVARADAVITTHGPVYLRYWLGAKHRPVFVDTWHGVGFKASLDHAEPQFLRYDAHFVSSPTVARYYESAGAQPVVTGYARTDVTIESAKDPHIADGLRSLFGSDLPAGTPIVLFAPTWVAAGEDDGESALPPVPRLVVALNDFAVRHGFAVVYRGHINAEQETLSSLDRIRAAGQDIEPITETMLGGVDVVLTDWSSIATDFLATGRPTVYLDRPAPDAHPAPLDVNDRPGVIASSLTELEQALAQATLSPDQYLKRFASKRRSVVDKAWGATLDGRSSERYLAALDSLIFSKVTR